MHMPLLLNNSTAFQTTSLKTYSCTAGNYYIHMLEAADRCNVALPMKAKTQEVHWVCRPIIQ